MANSTYINTVNRVLKHSGQQPIADNTTFNDDTLLTKVQLQAKLFVDRANRRLIRTNRKRLSLRKYTMSLSSGTNSYALNAGTTIENLKQGSWFITTAGYGRQLEYIPYDTWLTWYPEGESTEGIPEYWFDLPPDGTGDKVGFSPPPSASLTVQYEGYQDVSPLTSATDTIEFTSQNEDILWDFAAFYLETQLAEGKAIDIAPFLDGLFSELRQLTLGARDKPPAVKLGMKLRGVQRWSRRWAYSPD